MLIPPSLLFFQFKMLGCRHRTVSVIEMAVSRLGTAKGFPGASDHKESTCDAGNLGSISGQGKYLEKGMVPSPVFLPGESPWTEEPGGLQPMGPQRVIQN